MTSTKMVHVSPPNSVVFVMDRSVGEVPLTLSNGLVSATPTCVAIGTLMELDGVTGITMSRDSRTWNDGFLVFDGSLRTPAREVGVYTAFDEALISLDVPADSMRVRVWANDRSEPNDIRIVLSEA